MKKYLLFILILLNIGLGLDVQAKSKDPFLIVNTPTYTPSTTTTGSVVVSFDCTVGGGWLGWCEHPSWSCNKFTCSRTFTSNTSGSVRVFDTQNYGLDEKVNYSVTNIVVPPTPPVITPPIIIVPPVETAPACNMGLVPYGCSSGSPYAQNETATNYTWSCANTLGDINCTKNKTVVTPVITPVIIGSPWPTTTDGGSAFDSRSSGISTAHYELIWCPSHANELNNLTNGCRSQFFSDEGGVATLLTDGSVNSPASLIDGIGFKIIGEGVLTIKTFISDNASNISKKTYVYKIDKTAPRFGDFVFSEKNLGQYMNIENYKGTDGQPSGLGINDLSTQSDGDIFPTLSTYTKTSASENPYTQNPLTIQQVRYKQTGLGAISPVVNVELQGATDTFGGIANHNFVSRASKIDFYKGNTVTGGPSDFHKIKTIDLTQPTGTQKNIDLNTFDFSKSGTNPLTGNDGDFINVRFSDNAGNYSEKAFYVYRDESKPDHSKFTFKFLDNDDLRLANKNSKMILANNATAIQYDWGTGPSNDHMASNILLKTEKSDNPIFPLNYQTAILNSPTNGNTSSTPFNFEKVDNDIINTGSDKNFRKYATEFETPGIIGNKICDAVGNCVNGFDVLKDFQVMANIIDNDKSNIAITSPTKAIANNPLNPGVDKYSITYKLKDIFGNTMRNVLLGGTPIKTVSTKFDFYNGLTGSLISSGSLINTDAVTLKGTEFSGSANLNNVILQETNTDSDGEFALEISSRVPTVGGYTYLKNSARLELDGVINNIAYSNTSNIHKPIIQNESIIFTGIPIVSIDSNIEEKKSNRYNLDTSSLINYGEITSPNYSGSLTVSANSKLNFEFASPFIYHAKDFNILRDGIDSQHTKYMVDNGSGMGNYKILEKYFDAININNNNRVDFYIGNLIYNGLQTILKSNINNIDYFAKYTAKAGQNFDKWGYISYVGYDAGSSNGYTYIPSISRGVAATVVGEETKASANFPNVIASGGIDFLTQDIAITGLVNKIDGLVNTNSQAGLASLDLERPYTRAELLEKIKKKIFTVNKIGNWCNGTSTDLDETVGNHNSCTFNINGEIITFYDGNVEIDCGTTCTINDKRSIIVKNGRVTIKSNINTNGGNGQLFIASITDRGLENIEISNGSDHDIAQGKQKGWISIDENITNIDAFLLSQGPLVSSSTTLGDDIIVQYSNTDRLLNQLHIYGSVFSLNTISGDKTGDCPYIEQDCSQGDTAKIYDLSFLRRYALVDAGNFNGVGAVNVPFSTNLDYTNNSTITTKSSGGYTYSANGVKRELNTGLRTAKPEHIKAPVIIERDNRWTTNPSFFAKD